MNDGKRVFISYSTKDGAEKAASVRNLLETEDIPVWQDLIALQGNSHWWSQIENALRSSELDHFILIVTPGALASEIVRDEIRLARQEGCMISPVAGPGIDDLSELPRWLGHVFRLDDKHQKQLLICTLKAPSTQNRVVFMAPSPPEDFVERPIQYNDLKNQHLDAKGDSVSITTALRGAGGYGKTTLAKKLGSDPDIQDAYYDGILWIELGEKPDDLVSKIADLVEIITKKRPGFETLPAAASGLETALGKRRILLIIDDVWRQQDLAPLLQGATQTTRLITTRNDMVLPATARKQQVNVDAMSESEAISLLSFSLPEEEIAANKTELIALTQRLGEWALLLKLVNGFMLDNRENGLSLPGSIQEANEHLDEEGLTAFDSDSADDQERSKAVSQTIGISLSLLSEDEKSRFSELGIFPEDVDTPLAIVIRYWEQTGKLSTLSIKKLLKKLKSLSLLLSLDLENQTFRLHDTIRHYLIARAEENLSSQHQQLVDAMSDITSVTESVTEQSRSGEAHYYYSHLPMHLAEAGQQDALNTLLLSPKYLQDKLVTTRNPQSLIADYKTYATTEAQKFLGRTLRLTSGILARDQQQLVPQLLGR